MTLRGEKKTQKGGNEIAKREKERCYERRRFKLVEPGKENDSSIRLGQYEKSKKKQKPSEKAGRKVKARLRASYHGTLCPSDDQRKKSGRER